MGTFRQFIENQELIVERNMVTLYHGSTTGPNNEKLQSFVTKGIQPQSSQGQGQGGGFFVFTDFNKAAEHAIKLATQDPNNWMHSVVTGPDIISGSEHGGNPMVIAFQDMLNPKEYQFDLEINPKSAMGFISGNIDAINQHLPVQVAKKQRWGGVTDENGGGTVYRIAMISTNAWNPQQKHLWFFFKDPSTMTPLDQKLIKHNRAPQEEELEKWKDYAEYAMGGQSSIHQAQQINSFLQSVFEKAPQLKQTFDQINRSTQKAVSKGSMGFQAIKYIGTEPKKPSQIVVQVKGKWIDSQQYLNPPQPKPEAKPPTVDTGQNQDYAVPPPSQRSLLPREEPAQPAKNKPGFFARWLGKRQPQVTP